MPTQTSEACCTSYAIWHVIRRLRGRIGDADTTYGQATAAKRNIKAAVALLDWLATKDLTLATAGQGDLDAWLASMQPLRRDSGNFVRWARRHRLTQLDHAADRWGGPSGVIDTENRWDQARWLLHDNTVDTGDRVAGLLVLLYAQTAATISELTVNHVQMGDQQVRLRLGREPILIPAPLDNLLRELVENRFGHAAVGRHCDTPWLFPGGRPGQSLQRLPNRRATASPRDPVQPSTIQPPCSSSPPTSPPPSWPAPSASTSAWPPPGSVPAPGIGLSYAAEVSRRTTH